MKANFIGHQGDCMFYRIDEGTPEQLNADKQCQDGVLAYGEVTGHAHMIVDGDYDLSKTTTGMLYLVAKTALKVEHGREKSFTGTEPDQDYHKPVELPPGRYLIGIVEETDHIGEVTRRVAD